MSLRDIANKAAAGFDPKTDAIVTASGLPAGDYTVVLSNIEHRAFDSGWDCFGTTYEVVEGDHTGQKENEHLIC